MRAPVPGSLSPLDRHSCPPQRAGAAPPPAMAGDQELFEQWFRIADADRDGAVGGSEAVAFFGRSGLPQATLFQAGGRAG